MGTEHRAHLCRCGQGGERTRAAFPEGVTAPGQYGGRIAACVVSRLHYQLIPEDRLVERMADLFGVRRAAAALARMRATGAGRFQGLVEALCRFVKTAAVKQLDATGFRIGGKPPWLHVAVTAWLSFYRVSPQRGHLLDKSIGIVVHDHWKPYYTLQGVLHALGNAHHLRELRAKPEPEQRGEDSKETAQAAPYEHRQHAQQQEHVGEHEAVLVVPPPAHRKQQTPERVAGDSDDEGNPPGPLVLVGHGSAEGTRPLLARNSGLNTLEA